MPGRKIVHVDMDAFFASVEIRDQPSLQGKPVAVAYHSPRSVVTTASYEARAFGVHSALPLRTALQRCPGLIVVEPRMAVYREVSQQIQQVFHTYTDLVEMMSVDEAFLDLTHPLQGPASATLLARKIKRDITARTGGLTASVGVSYCKSLSKLASGQQKPDGLTVILPAEADAVTAALPIEAFYGIGPKTAERMYALDVRTGQDLRRFTLQELQQRFGKVGQHYYNIVRGIDERPVDPSDDRKSVGSEDTFEADIRDLQLLRQTLGEIAGRTAARLAHHHLAGRTVTLKIKFDNFQQLTRQITLPVALSTPEALHRVAVMLLTPALLQGRAVRLLGMTVGALQDADQLPAQPALFQDV
ncbi:DNA polymerase IV (plasmid) [Deinococcus sp. KNUC1210]|uniref:DNA polymerase IV n=1 Tax=Deinococcus sp. KNUC1210 TaxID=2917691 RepID=UPI001EF090A1|nr:DNA polymerase IV [Deinococcus sp. KNUC1210]ULH18013.1 DNA polymerase IV [Deinococcus sp. KNUC1210]